MGFIMEFAENLILRMMEDPEKRDSAQREHVYRMKERCERTKAAWSLPLRPYGFWTFDRFNSQLSWDPRSAIRWPPRPLRRPSSTATPTRDPNRNRYLW
ncbi:hypothetical protein GUJ93_ZPchr0003g18682 [Zizania palustris]|uniref:Uncharacterized protein n=1 Tax=Zizania palustris TaxID=103762 RepID=A0A8J5RPB1_ZIZPA|nr:hypothetical protein GUJ93_ZPchr0003g18682 [Zizania palustris]